MLFRRLGELDTKRGLALVRETGGFHYDFQAAVLSGWAVVDWEAALEWCRGQSDDRSRLRGMAAVLEEMAGWDREGALDVYLEEVAAKRMSGWSWNEREIFGRWAQDDPEGAVAAGLRVQEATGRDGPLKLTVEAWGKFEGAAAGEWVKREVEAGRLEGIAYGYLMAGWAEVDMRAAGDFGLERFGKKGFGNAMLHVMNAWAHRDFGEAASWVQGIVDEEVRGRMQVLLVSQSGDTANREPALEYALKQVERNDGMLRAVTGHGCELATRSGAEVALAWGGKRI